MTSSVSAARTRPPLVLIPAISVMAISLDRNFCLSTNLMSCGLGATISHLCNFGQVYILGPPYLKIKYLDGSYLKTNDLRFSQMGGELVRNPRLLKFTKV